MKAVLIALSLLLVSFEAQAISRYNSTSMSCNEVKATVRREGAVILRYQSTRTPGLPFYDRYVRSQSFCDMGEVRARASVPSADTNSCIVYKCKRVETDRHFRRRIFPN